MPTNADWYWVENIAEIDSPSLLLYKSRVEENIQAMLRLAGNPARLMPHIKTHKMAEVTRMYQAVNINRFKCATISEAEMLGSCEVAEALLAYQPVGPKLGRWIEINRRFPRTRFAALCDNENMIRAMNAAADSAGITLQILLDVNGGMGRTGIAPGKAAFELYALIEALPHLEPGGIHAYDGHVTMSDVDSRQQKSDQDFETVWSFYNSLLDAGYSVPKIIVAGSPSFPTHTGREVVLMSPGTTVFWDAKYGGEYPEMPFNAAVLVLCRVISKPGPKHLCLDLGHKSIAAENPPMKRVQFLNLQVEQVRVHSEEHLVVESPDARRFEVGDVVYGIPYHICPTVALHQEAHVIEDGNWSASWPVVARDRRISI